jgi:UDP-N-acetylglucosamine 2-epimerase (non-hydrolysing)
MSVSGTEPPRPALAKLATDPQVKSRADADLSQVIFVKRLILVTGHRHADLDGDVAEVCQVLQRLAQRDDVDALYVMHLSPAARSTVRVGLEGSSVWTGEPSVLWQLR